MYTLKLTGEPDIFIPMLRFQAKQASGKISTLSATVPISYAPEIEMREAGDLIIYKSGVIFMETNFQNATTYIGVKEQSIVLEGTKTKTYTPHPDVYLLRHINFYAANQTDGKYTFQSPMPQDGLTPADAAFYDGVEIIVGEIQTIVSSVNHSVYIKEL